MKARFPFISFRKEAPASIPRDGEVHLRYSESAGSMVLVDENGNESPVGSGDVTNAAVAAALAEDPAEANQALSSGQIFNVKASAYGATGDGVFHNESGAISATSTTLVVTGASFGAGDVGKRIIVRGAGASVVDSASQTNYRDLATSISAVINATTVTLADAATTTVSDADVLYGTDDTEAIQAAIDAASAVGGTVFIPKGIYVIDGDAQDSGGLNTILRIPMVMTQQSLEIVGESPTVAPKYTLPWPSTVEPAFTGTVLFRTKAHSGRLVGGDPEGAADTLFGRNLTRIANLSLCGYNGAAYKAIGLEEVAWCQLENLTVHTWEWRPDRMLEPPAGSIGIALPIKYNGAWTRGDNIWVQSFETGITMTEHSNIGQIAIQFCKWAVTSHSSMYASTISRLQSQWNAIDVYSNAVAENNLLIENFSWETYNTSQFGNRYFNRVANIVNPTNTMNLTILKTAGQLALGGSQVLTMDYTGGKNVRYNPQDKYTIDPRAFHPSRASLSTGSFATIDIAGQIVPTGGTTGNEGCIYTTPTPPSLWSITWDDVYSKAGKMRWSFVGRKSNNSGIAKFYVDGILVHTEDMYAASSVANYLVEIDFNTTKDGVRDFKIEIDGKNASSSAYNLFISQISLNRRY